MRVQPAKSTWAWLDYKAERTWNIPEHPEKPCRLCHLTQVIFRILLTYVTLKDRMKLITDTAL